jgi:serine phosphatase RsbU (regulator of sigma subunit)
MRALRRDPDALLLLIPVVLVDGFYLANNVTGYLSELNWWKEAPDLEHLRFHTVPFDVGPYTLFNILFLVALLGFLIRRFSLARRKEEHLEGQLEAARQVQQILVPASELAIPGFQVECVYLPAESVGGDFFQQLQDGKGGLLIVVGDVAGKGLPAAMVVSMLVGAIRSEVRHSADPAALLSALNERMLDRAHTGFATCLVARVSEVGRLDLACAGHPPPWLNGRALEIDGSLPLGIVAESDSTYVGMDLSAGDRLTFVSDGVLEAQSPTGELFGFDRTALLSREPAKTIARAAQQFGQQDDITVVAITLAPAVTPT